MSVDRSEPKGWHSRGYLPHFDSPERTQHVVFRTYGSLAKSLLETLPTDATLRRTSIDLLLDQSEDGRLMADPAVAQIVERSILHFDGSRYSIVAWCVMPNHVHALVAPNDGWQMGEIVASWKRYMANEINKARGTEGAVWAPDYFDRFMRDEEHLEQTIHYIENNPVKAGFVTDPTGWYFSSARRRRGPRTSKSANSLAR